MKMVKVKVAEATDLVLDWAVAMCEGGTALAWDGITWGFTLNGELKVLAKGWAPSMSFLPSTDPKDSWQIIDREGIAVLPPVTRRIGPERHAFNVDYWRAMKQRDENEGATHGRGPTSLIAAMRCFVTSRLGEEIEVPAQLLQLVRETSSDGHASDEDQPVIERPRA